MENIKRKGLWMTRLLQMKIHILAKSTVAAYFLILFQYAGSLYADEATDIINQSEIKTKSKTEQSTFRMELLDKSGKVTQVRTLDIFYKKDGTTESTLQKFLSPRIMQGTGLLIEDKANEPSDIWYYLSSTRRLRRISGAEKSNWYMGTEFTYEDFEDYQTNLYRFTLLKKAACNDSECYVIEATPATEDEKNSSGYSKKIFWIELKSLYPIQVEYFTKNDHMSKKLTASDLTLRGNYWRPKTLTMQNLDNGNSTRMIETKRIIDAPLKNYYVSKRYLRKD